jgi:hypothetical protein
MRSLITWQSIRWHINRTPLSRAIKFARRLPLQREIGTRRALLAELPDTSVVKKHAGQLLDQGYSIITDVVDPVRMAALAEAGEAKLARAHAAPIRQDATHKDFWVRLLDEDKRGGMLSVDNPFVHFALQPEILAIVGHAFGELPRLDYVLLTLSKNANAELNYSQLWHRDYDDTRVVKLFVYLTDVRDLADGPFTFIPGPMSDRVGFRLRSHQTDSEISTAIPLSAAHAIEAPRLTAFMVDTARCLHMGSRVAQGHERLLYTATFISIPRLYPEPPPFFRLTGDESRLIERVLTAL